MSVALVIQRAKRMRRVILLYVVCLALAHFSTLRRKGHDFREKVVNLKRVLIFSATFS